MTAVGDPVLPGTGSASRALRVRAAEAGWDVLHRMRAAGDEIREVRTPDPITGVPVRAWHPLGLDPGDLGTALAYAAADALRPDEGWDRLAFGHVRAAVEAFRTMPGLGIGLFSGTAGLAFTLRALDRGGSRYRQAVHDVDAALHARLEVHLAELDPALGTATRDYDVVSGMAGAVCYVLATAARHGPLASVAVRVLERLCDLVLTPPPGGLWTPPSKITDVEREHHAHLLGGYLDLGYAHGAAGVLAVLGRARERGVGPARLDEAITTLAAELVGDLQPTEYGRDLPYHRIRPDRPATQGVLSRAAWCYGNPGLALALTRVGAIVPQAGAVADELLASVHRRPASLLFVDNPSLCHGLAGLLAVARLVDGASSQVDDLVEQLLDHRDPAARFGFRNVQRDPISIDSPGFLEGSAGAAVALVSFAADPTRFCAAEDMLLGGFSC